jgi:hypothetical protein|eukprot:scaffold10532_cov449-Chaetoceros_neogracile.AAC.6
MAVTDKSKALRTTIPNALTYGHIGNSHFVSFIDWANDSYNSQVTTGIIHCVGIARVIESRKGDKERGIAVFSPTLVHVIVEAFLNPGLVQQLKLVMGFWIFV